MADSTTDKKPGVMQRLIKAAQYLINGADQAWFGPGQPMTPMAPANQAGRQTDYQISVNTRIQPRPEDGEGITFADLRMLADNHDVTRLLIETRKDQLEALEWTIKADLDTDDKKAKATPEQEDRIEACVKFFQKPDGVTPFSTWLRMLVEDLLVIDQPVIYVNTRNPIETRFETMDGATIKRFLDGFGGTPEPPNPAYQQIIHGMPSWDYTTDEIVFMPRNPRTHKMYGMSPVQQIVMIVNIAMRRQLSQLQYFTDGNIPDALIGTPKEWTPQQVAEFQRAWDALHEGNTAQRRHAKFVPGDAGKIMQTREVQLKDLFDEWLARIACYAFSMPPTAFIAQNNRATAQTAKQAAEEEGLAPLMRWVIQLMNELLHKHLGQDDLVFDFVMSEEQDLSTQVELIDTQVKNGTMTINEAREILGRDPIDGGDTAMIYMGTQPIPVDQAAEGPPPPPAPFGGMGAPGAPGGPAKPPFGAKPKPGQKALPAPGAKPNGKQPANGKKPKAKGVGKVVNVPFAEVSTDELAKYSPDEERDDHGRWANGGASVSLTDSKTRAFNGEQVKLKTQLSKLETGALGERIAIAYLQDNGLKDAKSLNVRGNNFPVDLVGDHELIEVKAGLASNGGTAQQWRATIGGPGKEEKAWLKTAEPADRRAWNLRKQQQIIDRKNKVVRDFSKKLGRDVKPRTLTVILNPDKHLADVYMFKGFHSRITWGSDEAKKAFVGSYRYGQ